MIGLAPILLIYIEQSVSDLVPYRIRSELVRQNEVAPTEIMKSHGEFDDINLVLGERVEVSATEPVEIVSGEVASVPVGIIAEGSGISAPGAVLPIPFVEFGHGEYLSGEVRVLIMFLHADHGATETVLIVISKMIYIFGWIQDLHNTSTKVDIMPFKSKAQERLFFAKEHRGELPKGTAERWAEATPDIKDLPEHIRKHAEAYESGFIDELQKIASGQA